MITDLQKQARRLRAQIAEAFDAVPYPGNENLYEGGQRDDDYEDVIRHLTGKHWRGFIPKRKPRKGYTTRLNKDMCFCSPEAWHFFLPGHLITELVRQKIEPLDFEPYLSERLEKHMERKFSRLNEMQCTTVVSYLEYADALFIAKQIWKPKHSNYYKWQRQRLSPVLSYWKSRTKQ